MLVINPSSNGWRISVYFNIGLSVENTICVSLLPTRRALVRRHVSTEHVSAGEHESVAR